MRDIFQTYLVSFAQQVHYQAMKLELPLYQQLMHLHTHSFYYLRGHVIKFLHIEERNLNLLLKYIDRQQCVTTETIDLKACI